jgi:hypothetical protein
MLMAHCGTPRFRPAPRPTGSCPRVTLPHPHHTHSWVGGCPAYMLFPRFHFAACLPRARLILASLISAEDAIRMGVWPSFRTRTSCITSSVLFLDRRCVSRGFVDSATHCDPVRGPRSTRMGYAVCDDFDAQAQRSLLGFLSPSYRSSLIRRMSLFHFTALL